MLLKGLCLITMTALLPVSAADWLQFRGPNRDGVAIEKGLLRAWPEGGPKEFWRVPVGAAFSAISVEGDKLYTMDSDDAGEYVLCADAKTGKTIWRTELDALFTNNFGNGPRSTPTVEGDTVYALASRGTLAAVNKADGSLIWKTDIKTFGSEIPTWAFCAAPLIVDDQLILETGGKDGKNLVSFNKKNGEVNWTASNDDQAYSSPVLMELGGIRHIVALSKEHIAGFTLDGKEMWKQAFVQELGIKPAPPLIIEGDKIFVSASYDAGAKLVQLKASGGEIQSESLWEAKVMNNHFNGSVAQGRIIYGFHKATFKCMDVVTQEQKWVKRGLGKGSLIMSDGLLFVMGERGRLVLVEATPKAYTEKGSMQVLTGRCWTQPTLSNGVLYVRNNKEMVALKVK
ncbi:MAG: PQQ-like beta-propeller repeat protein [Acidobacteriota bacterium]|nr:PQQ-like beta-propeller repeat protein [Acidobacteriota bacterium]